MIQRFQNSSLLAESLEVQPRLFVSQVQTRGSPSASPAARSCPSSCRRPWFQSRPRAARATAARADNILQRFSCEPRPPPPVFRHLSFCTRVFPSPAKRLLDGVGAGRHALDATRLLDGFWGAGSTPSTRRDPIVEHTKSPYGHVLPPNPLPGRADAPPLLGELDDARREGVQRVVAAAPDLVAGDVTRAALPHEDLARVYFLAAEALDAEALAGARAAVLRGAAGLLRGCSYLYLCCWPSQELGDAAEHGFDWGRCRELCLVDASAGLSAAKLLK